MAEEVYLRTKTDDMPESVHLCVWPTGYSQNDTVLKSMIVVRDVVSDALQVRSASGIKVRQPLQSITIASTIIANDTALKEILKDELNVKEVVLDASTEKITIDTTITEELQQEGDARELMRAIQGTRKDAGLEPSDVVTLFVSVTEENTLPEFIENFKDDIAKTVGAESIIAESNTANLENPKTLTINGQEITFAIKLQI
jgi:isoleucyl-tRNA synthetase